MNRPVLVVMAAGMGSRYGGMKQIDPVGPNGEVIIDYEKNSERKIICDISEYPYTLLWSAPTKPMRFICIEPWQSLPAAETDTSEWNEHAAAACIAPNESYSITLHTTFER